MIKPMKIFVMCAVLLGLSGCATKESAKVAATVDNDFVNAYDAFEMAKNPRAKVASGDTVSMSDGVWLGNKSVVLEHRNNLPSMFETDTGVTILLNEPVSLQVLANDIYSVTGIPVKIDGQISAEKLKKLVNVAYTGKLSGLLSQVATDLDLLWYYDKNSIVFYETETKTFTLSASANALTLIQLKTKSNESISDKTFFILKTPLILKILSKQWPLILNKKILF